MQTTSSNPRRVCRPARLSTAQQKLVTGNLGLVGLHLRKRVPTPMRPRREREYEDLFQEGCIALIRAAGRYDPGRDGEFPAFALPRIRGAVHSAIYSRFSLIRNAISCGKPPENSPRTEPLSETTMESSKESCGLAGERLCHAIRQRFERAVAAALADLRARRWRRRNPCAIIERLASERLLVGNATDRTALRQIAREFSVSSSRVLGYERLLHDQVRTHLERDLQLPMLLRFAQEDPRGFDGVLDAARQDLLVEAELAAFASRFESMPKAERAVALYELVERSSPCMREIARNLYRLAGGEPEDAYCLG